MMTTVNWMELHDASLESLELHWSSGEVILRILTGAATTPRRVIAASSTYKLECGRKMPWGVSESINEVRGPTPVGDDRFVLEIEMQSGDVIRIEAGAFRVKSSD
jgi:hypothetical protein